MDNSRTQTAKRNPLTCGGAIEPIGDRVRVRGRLAIQGWPSLSAWAAAHGYGEEMANYTVKTWGNRTDKAPHGGVARALMRDLRRTLAEGIGPQERQDG